MVGSVVLERSFPGVRWIGGGSGAGKSTIARRLATALGAQVYDTDEAMSHHAQLLSPHHAPRLHRFLEMTMDERWLSQQPAEMLESFHWFAGEGFDLVVDDLVELVDGGPVVAEGFRLLPGLVAPLLDDAHDAVWLLPTPAFRRMAFEQRGSLWTIAGKTTDRQRALDNLLERDRLFTHRLRNELSSLGLTAIEVDVGDTEDDVYERVAERLRPAPER
jgi:2-phosphoglycerate kinase